MLIYELKAYIGAHSIFTTHPHLPAAALVQAIKWHLYYSQTDPHGGEFSFILPDNPAVCSCLGWVAHQAKAGPGCSILYRSISHEQFRYSPMLVEFEIVISCLD